MTTTLIDAATLVQHRTEPHWVIVDCRHDLADPKAGQQQYAAGHIPGARFFHADTDLSGAKTGTNGRHPLPTIEAFAATLGRAGIDNATQVVAYDGSGGMMAARLWWMLRMVGHDQVAVLDGGWQQWLAVGGASDTAVPAVATTTYRPAPRPIQVDAAHLLARLDDSSLTIIDARARDRYSGENETMDPVAGHIPGALNRPYRDNLGTDGRFKSAVTLAVEWHALIGARDPAALVHSCGSGVSACHNLLALEVAGLPGGRLYPGSWSEWSADPRRPIRSGANP